MNRSSISEINHDLSIDETTTYAVPAWTFTLTGSFRDSYSWDLTFLLNIETYFYFW
jgi:hypothetical protein